MIKKFLAATAALGLAGAIGFAPSAGAAACGVTSSNDTSAETGTSDDVGTTPNGTLIYGNDPQDDGAGYLGASGSTGYIEVSGNDGGSANVDGASNGGEVAGSVGTDGVCVNDAP